MVNVSELLLSVNSVSLSFKQSVFSRKKPEAILRNLSFEIYRGETVGIIGRNGVGKSSLLKLLTGVFSPDGGEVSRFCRDIVLLGLTPGFDPQLSGRDNAIMAGILQGNSKQKMLSSMNEILEFSELSHHLDRPVRTYSAGMKARLGFSVALCSKPDILLIDEILGVGDAKFREKSEKAMREKIQSNQTVILVSHNENTLRQLCDRLLWIEGGELIMEGDVQNVLSKYKAALEEG